MTERPMSEKAGRPARRPAKATVTKAALPKAVTTKAAITKAPGAGMAAKATPAADEEAPAVRGRRKTSTAAAGTPRTGLAVAGMRGGLDGADSFEDSVSRIARQTLSERVYEDLKGIILAGQIPPGRKLTLRKLAAALGTSPMPVRDAASRLVAEKALELLPNRSLRVPLPTREWFEEIVTIRCALEGLAAETAAERITAAEMVEVRRHAKAFERAGEQRFPDFAAAIRHNRSLHFVIYDAARMPSLVEMIGHLWLRVAPVFSTGMPNTWLKAHDHHVSLLDALERRDGPAARAALTADIRSAADLISANWQMDATG